MSHFTVVACLPGGTDLTKLDETLSDLMAKWDENREVERYPSYEKGEPSAYWWVSSVRRGAVHHRDGTGLIPYSPVAVGWSSRETSQTPDEQRAGFAEDARWAERLGLDIDAEVTAGLTWATVASLFNEKWGHSTALAPLGDDSDSETLHVDDEGRAFTWSTRNPEARWDWWTAGGRWRSKFHAKQSVGASALIIAEPSRFDDRAIEKFAPNNGLRCDGGPRGLLDFESMRAEAETRALALFDLWASTTEGLPPLRPWSEFRSAVDAGEMDIDAARAEYHGQPALKAAREVEELKWIDNPGQFSVGRDAYAAAARADEVSGYALIDLDGNWIEPGRMGWWGVSHADDDDRATYKAKADAYLEALADDVLLVLLDCHI